MKRIQINNFDDLGNHCILLALQIIQNTPKNILTHHHHSGFFESVDGRMIQYFYRKSKYGFILDLHDVIQEKKA